MSEIDPLTGLPKELGVWEDLAKKDQRIKIREDKRKFGKIITVIGGFNKKDIDVKDIAKKLKAKFACGGTVKENVIELQGSHAAKAKQELKKLGFEVEEEK